MWRDFILGKHLTPAEHLEEMYVFKINEDDDDDKVSGVIAKLRHAKNGNFHPPPPVTLRHARAYPPTWCHILIIKFNNYYI